MTKTCFLIAMPEEINLTKLNEMQGIKLINRYPFEVYQLVSKPHLYIAISGIGMVCSAACCQFMIDKFDIDEFVSLGSAGTTNGTLKPLDEIVIAKSYYGDSDLTTFGYEMNQMARQPICFESSAALNRKLLNIGIELSNQACLGTCYSINSFLNHTNIQKFNALIEANPSCTEMELIGMAQICDMNNKPWGAFKIISDSILVPTLSSEQFQVNLKLIADLIMQVVLSW